MTSRTRRFLSGLLLLFAIAVIAAPVLASGALQEQPGNPIPPPAMGQAVDAWIPVVILLVVLAIGFIMRATAGNKS